MLSGESYGLSLCAPFSHILHGPLSCPLETPSLALIHPLKFKHTFSSSFLHPQQIRQSSSLQERLSGMKKKKKRKAL